MNPEWFDNPGYTEDDERLAEQVPDRPEESVTLGAPFTVTADGQVSGHVALWGRCHIGIGSTCVQPPREDAGYRGYLTGEAVPGKATGPVVIGGGHAPMSLNASSAQAHYDTTSKAVADVVVGPDDYGIWAAGAIRPNADPNDIQALKGSAISGDWRSVGGKLRLVALLAVNAPGFRVNRPHVIAASGSLITTGPACEPCREGVQFETIEDRVERLERIALGQMVASV
jgi:hypothetical protein